MPRQRSKDEATAISITLPRSLLDEIDDQLTRTSSRSKWIADACRYKLGTYEAGDVDTRRLLAMLHARATSSGDETLATLLLDRLTS